MTAESNYAIAIAKLIGWFKNLAPVSQPMRNKNQNHSDLARAIFPALLASYG